MILNVKGAVITACICVMSVNLKNNWVENFDDYQIAFAFKSNYRLINIKIQLFHNVFR